MLPVRRAASPSAAEDTVNQRPVTPVVAILALLAPAVAGRAQVPLPAPVAGGTGGPTVHQGPMDTRPATPTPAPPVAMLPPPFTAEQICAELRPGLTIVLGIRTEESTVQQRWTVVDSDGERVTIEYAQLGEHGEVVGEPVRRATACTELRDHASWPADRAVRDPMQGVETMLGVVDGWMYRVKEDDEGTVGGYLFSPTYPGPPVTARVVNGDTVVQEMWQVSREHREPAGAPSPAPGGAAAPAPAGAPTDAAPASGGTR